MTKASKSPVLWITQSAVLIALLIVMQAATAPLGNTLITGSLVNLLLIVSVMAFDLSSGIAVAVLSPIFAKLVGIGPLWAIIPFIALGNLTLVITWHLINTKINGREIFKNIIALVIGALAKFAVLYLSIVKLVVPYFLDLPEKQAAVISAMFSVPQIITAAIGGGLAIIILPILNKAFKRN